MEQNLERGQAALPNCGYGGLSYFAEDRVLMSCTLNCETEA